MDDDDIDAMIAQEEVINQENAYAQAQQAMHTDNDNDVEQRPAQRQRTFGNVPLAQQSPGGDEVSFAGERTRAERDAEGRRMAIDLDSPATGGSTAVAQQLVAQQSVEPPQFAPPHPSLPPAAPPAGLDDEPPLSQEAELAPEQQRAFDLAMGGSNLFITGGPGTGKSFTTQRIIHALEEEHGSGSVLVWAPTGVAAILVGGQTMQSKPGPGVPSTSTGFENVWGNKKYWRAVRTLVLDEVSMADAEFIDWAFAGLEPFRNAPRLRDTSRLSLVRAQGSRLTCASSLRAKARSAIHGPGQRHHLAGCSSLRVQGLRAMHAPCAHTLCFCSL